MLNCPFFNLICHEVFNVLYTYRIRFINGFPWNRMDIEEAKLYGGYSAGLGIIIILLGFMVLIGWSFNISGLTNVLLKWGSMRVNAAICFIFTGVGILFIRSSSFNSANKTIVLLSALVIISICVLTLLEYFTARSIGIYGAVLSNPSITVPIPLRMTLLSSILFLFIGTAFILMLKKVNPWFFQTCLWIVFTGAFFSLCNYMNNFNGTSYTLFKMTTMPVGTTLLFVLSCIGMLLASPNTGIMNIILGQTTGGFVLRLILPFIILEPLLVSSIVNIGEDSNLYPHAFRHSMDTVASFILLSIIVAIICKLINQHQLKIDKSTQELQESERIFHEFAEKFKDAVLYRASIGADKLFYVSPAYEKIWGEPVEKLYKNPRQFYEMIVPEDQKQVANLFFKIQSESSIELNYRIHRSDGTIRHIFDKAYQLKDENGQPKYIIGIALDVTESMHSKKLKILEENIFDILKHEDRINIAIPNIARIISEFNGWDLYELWLIDESSHVLRCVNTWMGESKDMVHFHEKSEVYTFKIGEGLPGMAWQSQHLVIMPDYVELKGFHRAHAAKEAGLRGALGLPLISNNKVLGILNFFSMKQLNLSEEIKSFLERAGNLIGDFIYLKHTKEQIERVSRYDLLTNLLNRSAFTEVLETHIKDKETLIPVFILDIHRFRIINESQGHDQGDILLKQIASRVLSLAENNQVARLVADKFIMFSEKCHSYEEIEDLAEKYQQDFKKTFNIIGQEILLSVHLGIAIFPKDGKDAKTLINNANIALTYSKNRIEKKYQFFDPSMFAAVINQFKLGKELINALKEDQFVLYFQPQINLETNEISGAEALLRWNHPEKGLLSPSHFLLYAQENALMIQINEYVLRAVFRLVGAQWKGPPISVNISPEQFLNQYHLLEYLEQLLNEYRVDPKHIVLEITENMMMQNVQHNLTLLSALQETGFKISIDDFGTGYSSFSYIQRFKVDEIKIDKSFIHGIPTNLTNATIVKSIIRLFHSLETRVIAEGAETKQEVDYLKMHQCDSVQGYYFYKPLPLEQFLEVATQIKIIK